MTNLSKAAAAALTAALATLMTGCADLPAADKEREYRGEYVTGSNLRRNDLGATRLLGRDELERMEASRPGSLDPPPGLGPQAPR